MTYYVIHQDGYTLLYTAGVSEPFASLDAAEKRAIELAKANPGKDLDIVITIATVAIPAVVPAVKYREFAFSSRRPAGEKCG